VRLSWAPMQTLLGFALDHFLAHNSVSTANLSLPKKVARLAWPPKARIPGGGWMPKPIIEFVIDDGQSVSANLQNFSAILQQIDPDLSKVLDPFLKDLATSEPLDLHGIWDALLQATMPEAQDDLLPARDAA